MNYKICALEKQTSFDAPAEICVRDLNDDGQAVASLPDGLTCFINGLLPGERAFVRITEKKSNYALAECVELISASAFRVKPPCPVFEQCGGCDLQHLKYDAQLEIKRKKISDAFQRIGSLALDVPQVMPSARELGYRNKTIIPVGGNFQNPEIGFFQKRSHSIISMDECPVSSAPLAEILKSIRQIITDFQIPVYDELTHSGIIRSIILRKSETENKLMLVITSANKGWRPPNDLISRLEEIPSLSSLWLNINLEKTNVFIGRDLIHLRGEKYLTEEALGYTFRISPVSFFQVNTLQMRNLYLHVKNLCSIKSGGTLIDLYCGTGTMTICLSEHFEKSIGVEINKTAVEDAIINQQNNKVLNTHFFAEDSLRWLKKNSPKGLRTLVINPPRKGFEDGLAEASSKTSASQLIYISCKPSTLARDAKILCASGWKIQSVQAFDMFAQTMQVETVVEFCR